MSSSSTDEEAEESGVSNNSNGGASVDAGISVSISASIGGDNKGKNGGPQRTRSQLTDDEKAQIILLRNQNWTFERLGNYFQRSKYAIFQVVQRFKERGTVERKRGTGRPALDDETIQSMLQTIREHGKLPCRVLRDMHGMSHVSVTTIGRAIRKYLPEYDWSQTGTPTLIHRAPRIPSFAVANLINDTDGPVLKRRRYTDEIVEVTRGGTGGRKKKNSIGVLDSNVHGREENYGEEKFAARGEEEEDDDDDGGALNSGTGGENEGEESEDYRIVDRKIEVARTATGEVVNTNEMNQKDGSTDSGIQNSMGVYV